MLNVPPVSELKLRLARFRQLLHQRKLSAALIVNERNVRWLSGFTGGDSALLITGDRKWLLTDFRYIEDAHQSAKGWPVVTKPPGLMEKAADICRKRRIRTLAIEPGSMRVVDMRALRRNGRGLKIKPEDSMVGELRLIKSDWEVRQIEKALRIQEQAFQELCRQLRPGIRESDAAALLRYKMCKAGAEDESFSIMFQVGSNSSRPHGRPTDRKLTANSVILIDWGALVNGYHSDLTRTFFLGTIPRTLRKIHGIVLEAQLQAISRIAPGVAMSDVDGAARKVIQRAGYGKAFGHSTGHGLGLDIHEAPSLSTRAKGTLAPGMVVTVEPGIYLPGIGGVRIEDDVLVTRTGARVLSRLKKGLRWNGDND